MDKLIIHTYEDLLELGSVELTGWKLTLESFYIDEECGYEEANMGYDQKQEALNCYNGWKTSALKEYCEGITEGFDLLLSPQYTLFVDCINCKDEAIINTDIIFKDENNIDYLSIYCPSEMKIIGRCYDISMYRKKYDLRTILKRI